MLQCTTRVRRVSCLGLSVLQLSLLAGAARSPMLQSFLADAKARLLAGPPAALRAPSAAGCADAPPYAPPTLVLGNTAGDVDTIVSSIVLAYARHAFFDGPPPSPDAITIPLMPFARREFRLRQDAVALFAHCGFAFDAEGAPPELLFADELDNEAVDAWHAAAAAASAGAGAGAAGKAGAADGAGAAAVTGAAAPGALAPRSPEPFRLILTDHNRLDAATAARLRSSTVAAIVDHHQDEGSHADAHPRLIDTAAGSACSLVALLSPRLLEAAAAPAGAAARADGGVALRQACALLLGAIALDTRGLGAESQKFSMADLHAAHAILSALSALGGTAPLERPALAEGASAAEVAAQAEWLRAKAPLPPPAALRGAPSLKHLSKALLECRFDVSSLSVADLLALDYKATALPAAAGPAATEPARASEDRSGGGAHGGGGGPGAQPSQRGVRVGVCAIFVPLPALLSRAGGGAQLEQAMGQFAAEKGVQVLLALTAADDRKAVRKGRADGEGREELTGLKGAAIAPALGGGERAVAAARALADALGRVPAGLPAALLAEPLYERQGIGSELGFGMHFRPAEGAANLRLSELRRSATRKTVLPAVAHLCKDL